MKGATHITNTFDITKNYRLKEIYLRDININALEIHSKTFVTDIQISLKDSILNNGSSSVHQNVLDPWCYFVRKNQLGSEQENSGFHFVRLQSLIER